MRAKSGLIFLAAATVVSSVWAATPDKLWNGSLSTAWETPGNWSPSGAPEQGPIYDFVVISGNLARYPVVSAITAVSGLSMAAGSQLSLDGSTSGMKTFTVNGTKASSFNGTITATGSNAQLCLSTGQADWTTGGTLEFGTGGNFSPTSDNYTARRTLTNNGMIRANAGTTIFMPFTTVTGGTLDGAWWARSTTGSVPGLPSHYLSFTGVTLGSNFSAASAAADTYPSTHIGPANLHLTNSVTNNSTAFNFPSYGAMTLDVTLGSTFTFSGTGSLGLAGQTLSGTGVSTIANNGTHMLKGYGTIGANLTSAGRIWATGGTVGTPRTLSASAIASAGTIVVDPYSTLSVSGTLLSDSGSVVTVNGTLTAPSISMAGTLSGSGNIDSVVTLTGTVSPGNSPGTLTMDGLVVGNGAQYTFELGDRLDVNGALEFQPGAVMTVHAPSGLSAGEFYPFLTFQSIVGTPSFILDGVGSVSRQGSSFGFQVPEPTILGMAGVICLAALVRRPIKRADIISDTFQA